MSLNLRLSADSIPSALTKIPNKQAGFGDTVGEPRPSRNLGLLRAHRQLRHHVIVAGRLQTTGVAVLSPQVFSTG